MRALARSIHFRLPRSENPSISQQRKMAVLAPRALYRRRSVTRAFARDTAVVRWALSAFVIGFHCCSGPMFKIKVALCAHGTNDAAHTQISGLPALFSAPSPQLSHRRSAPTKRHCGTLRPFSVMIMIEIESTVIVALTHALNVVIRDMGLGLLRRLEAHPSPLTHSLRSSRRSCFRGTNAPISSMLVP